MKRRLIKFSNYSFCITLPKKAIETLGWGKGEEVEVEFESRKKRIIVSKKIQENETSKSAKGSSNTKPAPKRR